MVSEKEGYIYLAQDCPVHAFNPSRRYFDERIPQIPFLDVKAESEARIRHNCCRREEEGGEEEEEAEVIEMTNRVVRQKTEVTVLENASVEHV